MPESSKSLTPVSLLQKLRQPTAADAQAAWSRFVDLYTPLLMLWTHRLGVASEEAADLLQEVFLVLTQKMPTFRYNPRQRFRGWLWTILVNKWRDRVRRNQAGPAMEDVSSMAKLAAPDNVEAFAEEEYRNYLVGRALELMRGELESDQWRACWEYVVRGRPAEEVALELGLSVNQVHLAKSRILRRLRTELEGLID